MSLMSFFLHRDLQKCPLLIHQDIEVLEERYKGKTSINMLGDYILGPDVRKRTLLF